MAVAITLAAVGAGIASSAEWTADQIIERSDDLMRGKTSYSEMTMVVTTPRYTRSVQMKIWTEGRDKAFIFVTAPARDAGSTFLKLGREMWNYRPDIERTIKIPPSMMLQSWMGSDFTNDDLARADSMIVDYDHRLTGEVRLDGVPCWKIELTPKPNAPVVWGKIVAHVSQDDFIGRRIEYYDEDLAISKTLTADRIITASGRKIASHVVMTNDKKPGQRTEINFQNVQFDQKIPADTFTQRNLTRGVR
jgi:outer membrane lipoprotein-sorting protein